MRVDRFLLIISVGIIIFCGSINVIAGDFAISTIDENENINIINDSSDGTVGTVLPSIFDGNVFSDISWKDWFFSEVKNVHVRKIMSGYGDGTFRPNSNIKRSETVSSIAKLYAGSLGRTSGYVFSDISGHWARDYIIWANRQGIINGFEDGTFRPENYITRQDFAVMIGRYLKNTEYYTLPVYYAKVAFNDDSSISSYAKPYVYDLYQAGIIKGYKGIFAPQAYITRAEAAMIFSNVVDLISSDYTPVKSVASDVIRVNFDALVWAHCNSEVSQAFRITGNHITLYELNSTLGVETLPIEYASIELLPASHNNTAELYYNNSFILNRLFTGDRMDLIRGEDFWYNVTYFPAHKYFNNGIYKTIISPRVRSYEYDGQSDWINFEHELSIYFGTRNVVRDSISLEGYRVIEANALRIHSEDNCEKMESIGNLLSSDNFIKEATVVAIIGNKPFSVVNCENEINKKINMGSSESREESIEDLVFDELIRREANLLNLSVSDEEVNLFIENQKNIIYNDSEVETEFLSFCQGMSISQDEYWNEFYEKYREIIIKDKYIDKLYDSYLETLLRNKLAEIDYDISDEEFYILKENEYKINHPVVQSSFYNYYHNLLKKDLFEKYDVEVLLQ